jgi:uncharacterized protein (DUF1501 family)
MAQGTGFVDGIGDDQNTVVVIFLRGGADGLTLVPPVGDDAYYRARPYISIKKNDAIALDGNFGLNPEMAALKRLYDDHALAIVHGVGSEDSSRSHFEAQDSMEQGGATAGGWIGRYLRASSLGNDGPLTAVAIGKSLPVSLRGAPSSVAMESFETLSLGAEEAPFLSALQKMYAHDKSGIGKAGLDSLAAMNRIKTMRETDYQPGGGAEYGDDSLSRGLRQVAQLIKAKVGLKAATIDLDGWDSHIATGSVMNPLMQRLSTAMSAFYLDLGRDMETTTLLVMTEFGRRIYENASFGTDHGRGSIMMAVGGGVAGGRVHSDWAGLEEDNLEGPGDLPVTINYRDVLAPILQNHASHMDPGAVFPGYELSPVAIFG